MTPKKPYEPVDTQTDSLADFGNQLGINQDLIEQLEGQ